MRQRRCDAQFPRKGAAVKHWQCTAAAEDERDVSDRRGKDRGGRRRCFSDANEGVLVMPTKVLLAEMMTLLNIDTPSTFAHFTTRTLKRRGWCWCRLCYKDHNCEDGTMAFSNITIYKNNFSNLMISSLLRWYFYSILIFLDLKYPYKDDQCRFRSRASQFFSMVLLTM